MNKNKKWSKGDKIYFCDDGAARSLREVIDDGDNSVVVQTTVGELKKLLSQHNKEVKKEILQWIEYAPVAISYKKTGARYQGMVRSLYWVESQIKKYFENNYYDKKTNSK